MAAWKCFSQTWDIAWKVEHGLPLLCSSLRAPEIQISEVVPVPGFVCYELELYYLNFLISWNSQTFVYSTETKAAGPG